MGSLYAMMQEFIKEPIVWMVAGILVLIGCRLLMVEPKEALFPVAGYELTEAGISQQPLPTIYWHQQELLAFVTTGIGPESVADYSRETAEVSIKQLFFEKHPQEISQDFLRRCCMEAHKKISANSNFNSGGCSIAMVHIKDGVLNWISAGNISIYVYQTQAERLNKRDLYRHQLRKKVLTQQISEDRALTNSLKDEVTNYLGHEHLKPLELSQQPISLTRQQKIIVCNEAFNQTISQIQLEKILGGSGKLLEKTKLLNQAYQTGCRSKVDTGSYVVIEKVREKK